MNGGNLADLMLRDEGGYNVKGLSVSVCPMLRARNGKFFTLTVMAVTNCIAQCVVNIFSAKPGEALNTPVLGDCLVVVMNFKSFVALLKNFCSQALCTRELML